MFLRCEKWGCIPVDEEPNIKAHFPNSKIKTITNAGHWLHDENPKDFYKELMSFIDCVNKVKFISLKLFLLRY